MAITAIPNERIVTGGTPVNCALFCCPTEKIKVGLSIGETLGNVGRDSTDWFGAGTDVGVVVAVGVGVEVELDGSSGGLLDVEIGGIPVMF